MSEYLTPDEVASMLKIHTSDGKPNGILIRRMALRGDLPGIKIGRQWRFRRDHVDDWLGRRAQRDPWVRSTRSRARINAEENKRRRAAGQP